jgi:hypothetical protein
MAISLADIQHSHTSKSPRIVIHGPPGVGKSTFGAGTPQPIFIQTEDGLGSLHVDAFPLAQTWAQVIEAFTALYQEKHDYQTLVVDSLSALETLIWAQVVKDHQKQKPEAKNIEDIGYSRGYLFALDYWQQFMAAVNALRDRGMIAVLIAHTDVVRFDSPESEPYDRYLIKLHKRAFQMLYEKVDIIGFANYQLSVTHADVGFNRQVSRGITTGERVLYLVEKPAFVAKNRYALPESVPLAWPALAAALSHPSSHTELQPNPSSQPRGTHHG